LHHTQSHNFHELVILTALFDSSMMLQQHTMQSSSTRLQTCSSLRSSIHIHASLSHNHSPSLHRLIADRTGPSALAAQSAPASRQQQQQQQQQRCLVATAAAAKKQAARAPAGKGFGNPNKLASKATSNASRKCPCGSGQLYPVSPHHHEIWLLFGFVPTCSCFHIVVTHLEVLLQQQLVHVS
jgi:hypothetical protein